MYLLVQNPGVAPVEGYTLLGVSTTRNCGVAGTIGQFGSGAKHAINTLLRVGLKLLIYCGKTRLEFATREETVNRAFFTLDQSKRDVLYVLPTALNASDFSKARFATALKLSPYLKDLFVDTNTVGLKSTGTKARGRRSQNTPGPA
jgi:hypothetical protein